MIGNAENAAYALDMFRDNDMSEVLSVFGSTRMVYLIDGIVYKVEKPKDGAGINEHEYEVITSIGDSEPGIAFPAVSLFDINGTNVLAMEYISGTAMSRCYCWVAGDVCDSTCCPDDVADILDRLDLDSNGMNVVKRDGVYYVIDAA